MNFCLEIYKTSDSFTPKYNNKEIIASIKDTIESVIHKGNIAFVDMDNSLSIEMSEKFELYIDLYPIGYSIDIDEIKKVIHNKFVNRNYVLKYKNNRLSISKATFPTNTIWSFFNYNRINIVAFKVFRTRRKKTENI